MDERLLVNYDDLVSQRQRKSPSIGTVGVYELASVDASGDTLSSNPRYAEPTPELTTYGNIKLGWIQGVLIPCLLNIWGVMLFLRIAWIVAQAGIVMSIVIIITSFIVCVITTLSLSAICTNGELRGGGVYYIVSRSLGAELGASVGIIFAFANAVAASMNTIGFCESLNELLKAHSLIIIDNGPHDTRIVGAIALLVMCFICAVGMDWETNTQNFLIVLIITAIINFVIGAAIGPTTDEKKARGFIGLNSEVAQQNLLPDYRVSEGQQYDFFSVFSIFFPAVTGVQAGANICGDLKSSNPRYAEPTPELTTYGNIKLGWIQGVLIPCLLNIWGVMLFLRIAWIVAQAGIVMSIVIIITSFIVCVITTLSLSAICTNGELRGGGVYYIVSRSLGAELGASVGIIFAFANAVAASMNTIGFCESLNELLKAHSLIIIDNGPHDTRIVGAIALLVMCFICAVGMDWETNTQNFLIVLIITAIINFVIGAAIGPTTDEKKARGFIGLNSEVAQQNLLPDYRVSEGQQYDFFSVFSIFFPAVTGVQAGANICGDLKDPATAIPKGTLVALAISVTSYLTMVALSGVGAIRDASGNLTDLANNTLQDCKPNCDYGLHNNNEMMQMMALWGPMIYIGCWAATLSTALTNLLSVPRLIQALGFDRLYPGLIFFSKPYGKHGEPYRGYVLTFFVSLLFLLIADLNTIAPLISNFYLASYALINFCTFHAAFFQPISWRPRFRFYNTWVSLAGFLMCLVIMMVISWVMALITTFIFITLYLLVLYRKPEASWGSSTEAQRYQETIASIVHIYHREANTKSYNPQLLVLAGKPDERPWLTDLGALITKVGSFMILADIESSRLTRMERRNRRLAGEEWLRQRKMRAFYVLVQGCSFEQGCQALLQTTGLGRIAPNVVLLGYKYDWDSCPHPDLLTYYHMIRLAFKFELAMAILYVPTNFRPYKKLSQSPSVGSAEKYSGNSVSAPTRERVVTVMSSDSDVDVYKKMGKELIKRALSRALLSTGISQTTLSIKRSQSQRILGPPARKIGAYKTLAFNHNSILDAWWLYDDGGMNILLPYIIARRSSKEKMSLRIFALPQGGIPIEAAEEHMESLLRKFRIDYSELTMITGIRDKPNDSTWAFFNNITHQHRSASNDDTLISDEEFSKLYEKTSRHLRLREMLLENSFGADFIVMTLPLPRQGISAAMYMSWLKVMCKDMPPILFVRGNSTVVIE